MNEVTQTTIVCGNNNVSDPYSIINCKKDRNDNEEIPILKVNVQKAFDFMESQGLQPRPIETTGVIYQLGKFLFYVLVFENFTDLLSFYKIHEGFEKISSIYV